MFYSLYYLLQQMDTIFWAYVGFSLIMILGIHFSLHTRFFQIRALPALFKSLGHSLFHKRGQEDVGIHPLKVLFASVGGMVGIGNLVGVITAVQLGGPGALLWIWIAALAGSLIKYSEVYLGLKHRVVNNRGSYDGGPMYFLQKAYRLKSIPYLVCILLCIYGVEIYQFSVIADSLSSNWSFDRRVIVLFLLAFVLYAGLGGVSRVGKISSRLLPGFIGIYIGMSLWVIFSHLNVLPETLWMVLKSAFTGHAAVGAFAGSSIILAIQHGMARAAYSADIGIGNDSVIHSESWTVKPAAQARLAVCGVFIDNMICTLSILLVLLTGIWKSPEAIPASEMVKTALSMHFPYMNIFMPLFILILGYTTIIAYFSVGIKSANFLFPNKGRAIYFTYAALALPAFSFLDQAQALLLMSLAGSLLLIINLFGIYRLRKDVQFHVED